MPQKSIKIDEPSTTQRVFNEKRPEGLKRFHRHTFSLRLMLSKIEAEKSKKKD